MSEQLSAPDQAREACQCEHALHFDVDGSEHAYQEAPAVSQVKTPYGIFPMCRECIRERHFTSLEGDRDA